MKFDIPHMVATAILIFVVLWVVNQTNLFSNLSKGRKTLVQFVILFIVLFALNLVWPYGSGV